MLYTRPRLLNRRLPPLPDNGSWVNAGLRAEQATRPTAYAALRRWAHPQSKCLHLHFPPTRRSRNEVGRGGSTARLKPPPGLTPSSTAPPRLLLPVPSSQPARRTTRLPAYMRDPEGLSLKCSSWASPPVLQPTDAQVPLPCPCPPSVASLALASSLLPFKCGRFLSGAPSPRYLSLCSTALRLRSCAYTLQLRVLGESPW
jgi:hypothetical protein